MIVRNADSAAVEDEAAEPLGSPPDRREREAESLLAHLLVELSEEHAGQVAHCLCVQEVELHETFDRGFSGPVGIVHELGNARLKFEIEPFLGAAREQVKVTAHRPEEALGPVEAAKLGVG